MAIQLDALVIGAGFGGIYQLHSLLQLGLSVRLIDNASNVGGTWFWNKYPGAMSDTESYIYRYTWDKEDLQKYPWSHHYVKQPQVLAYLNHIADRHDLRRHMTFETELKSARWDDDAGVWHIELSSGEAVAAQYVVTALGLLSKKNYPDIEGFDDFKGELSHTAEWDPAIKVEGKRVGVIGNGSTGVQVITEIASKAKTLTCFQRHPQYSVPSGDGPVSDEYRKHVNENYDKINNQVRNSAVGFGFEESAVPCMSVSPEEREKVFEELWRQGNGFRFMFGGFSDLTTSKEANEEACEFIRKKIAQTVKDPEKAKKLMPRDYYARRPLCDGGYYQQFNRDSVQIVDLKETPIERLTEKGMQTSDGKVHELDLLIFATGFDAVEGNYTRLQIHGQNGQTLKDHWSAGPTSYLGIGISHFPNLFMINGAQGPFTNQPPAIEMQVEFITKIIQKGIEKKGEGQKGVLEVTEDAERGWGQLCEKLVEGSLFKETQSWIFGSNVPGKKVALRFYFGGLKAYGVELQGILDENLKGFRTS